MSSRGNLIAGVVCALVIVGAIVVLVTGDDPPLEETRLGEGATSTSTTASTASSSPDANVGTPDLDAVTVDLEVVADFDQPIASGLRADEPGLYVAERGGKVFILRGGEKVGPVVDITGDTEPSGERGLLGMAFSPSGDFLYLSYTDLDGTSQIDEFAVDADGTVDAASRRNVLSVEQPFPNHNGGHVAFGPDGFLYFGLGDGGAGGDPQGNGQNPDTMLGSILRIDPSDTTNGAYGMPADNPFADGGAGAPEVFIFGVRNPWRFDFDDVTGDLWIADVGQNAFEEIDFLPSGDAQIGANLGWNVFEASSVFSGSAIDGTVKPVFEYGRDQGQSITGGVVYRGKAIPGLVGSYLFADLTAGEVRALRLDLAGCGDPCLTPAVDIERKLDVAVPSVAHFAEDHDGEVYLFSLEGTVSQLVAG